GLRPEPAAEALVRVLDAARDEAGVGDAADQLALERPDRQAGLDAGADAPAGVVAELRRGGAGRTADLVRGGARRTRDTRSRLHVLDAVQEVALVERREELRPPGLAEVVEELRPQGLREHERLRVEPGVAGVVGEPRHRRLPDPAVEPEAEDRV